MPTQRLICECLFIIVKMYIHYNVILIHKKEQNADTCYNMDKPQKQNVNLKKLGTKDHIFHDFIYMNYPEKAYL